MSKAYIATPGDGTGDGMPESYVVVSADGRSWSFVGKPLGRNRRAAIEAVLLRPYEPLTGQLGLTPCQLEVMQHIIAGGTPEAIARRMGISETSVNRHIQKARVRLSASTTERAAVLVDRVLRHRKGGNPCI